jgi:hypothetical protein
MAVPRTDSEAMASGVATTNATSETDAVWARKVASYDALVATIRDWQGKEPPSSEPERTGWLDYLSMLAQGIPDDAPKRPDSWKVAQHDAVMMGRIEGIRVAGRGRVPGDPAGYLRGWDDCSAEIAREVVRRSPPAPRPEPEPIERPAPSPGETWQGFAFGMLVFVLTPALIIAGIAKVLDVSTEAAGALFVVGAFIAFVLYRERH